jgi:xylulokinase
VKAIFEGTAYEMETIRRIAQTTTGQAIETIIAVGGGVRYTRWMQIKADVSGCAFEVCSLPDATLLGAAMIAGVGAQVYASVQDAVANMAQPALATVYPDADRNAVYRRLYEQGYLGLQEPLHKYYQTLVEQDHS